MLIRVDGQRKSVPSSQRYILHGVQGMPMTFFPTEDMQVVGLDLAAAAYIFNNVLDQDELLVPNPHCAVTRGALRTLEPGKLIVDDVSSDTAGLNAYSKLEQSSMVLANNPHVAMMDNLGGS
ncbi:uncharacterized protein DS421_16g553400 [Arachis hypogaea]|nr:uncharacterized protein DS421_16g553400 [Arachis hypogaea]